MSPIVSNAPFYTMPEVQQKKLIEVLSTIKIGSSYESVIEMTGKPSEEKLIRGKEFDAPVRGRIVKYCIVKYRKDLANEKHDRYITLVFDASNRLEHIDKGF